MNLQSDFGLVLLDLIIHGSDCFLGKFYIFYLYPVLDSYKICGPLSL